jgi:peptidyl-prolyl cis-trans isomerase C
MIPWLLVLVTPLALAGPPGTLRTTGEPVARIGNAEVTTDMMKAVQPGGVTLEALTDEQWQEFVEGLALTQALYDDAVAEKIWKDPEVALALAMSQRSAMVTALLARIGKEAADEEIARLWYDNRPDLYQHPRLRARHLLVASPEEADAARERIQGGDEFAVVAAEVSLDPGSSESGGDLGWFTEGMMVESFEQAAFQAQVGEVVGPVESQFGWHVLQVTDSQDHIPFEEVLVDIQKQLEENAIRSYLEERRANLDLHVLPRP